MGRASRLVKSRFSNVQKNRIRAGISHSITRGTNVSGEDTLINESSRIADYIGEQYLNDITDYDSALKAVESLRRDPGRGSSDDFDNLLRNGGSRGKEALATYIYNNRLQPLIDKVKSSKVKLRSGLEREGYKINSRAYLIIIKSRGKQYLQARNFKTGRAIKRRKAWFR